MAKVVRRFSEAFKRSVVAEVESGRYTAYEAARTHEIHFQLVYRWLKRFGGPDSQTRIMRIEMPTERDRIKELEKRNRDLESALAQAHMKIVVLESAVEVYEEQSGRTAKKKPDTASSNTPDPKGSV